MSNTLFTSDSHWGHRLVSGLRGFGTVEEPDTDAHDATLITNWNKAVNPGDTVWVCGDIAVRNPAHALEIIAELNGTKHLIPGNHDRCSPVFRDSHKHLRQYLEVFETVQVYARRRLNGLNVMLSHFPYLGEGGDHTEVARYSQHRLQDMGDWLLHGHTHLAGQRVHGHQIHIGLDAWDLAPVSLHTIENLIRDNTPTPEVSL